LAWDPSSHRQKATHKEQEIRHKTEERRKRESEKERKRKEKREVKFSCANSSLFRMAPQAKPAAGVAIAEKGTHFPFIKTELASCFFLVTGKKAIRG
jgi:hypothetical protein